MSAFSQLENEIYYVFELYVFFLDTSREVYFEFYRKIEELAQHSEDPDLHIFIHEYVSIATANLLWPLFDLGFTVNLIELFC